MKKHIALDLSACNGLGDLICATPVIKKLHEFYEAKVTVISKLPELFKNNPHVEASYKSTSVDHDYFSEHYIMHKTFHRIGQKDEFGVELKHNMMDLRQFHAIQLGFMLGKDELECFYQPTFPEKYTDLPKKYVVIHPVQNWATRTWSIENWMRLTEMLNEKGIYVISIGKTSAETGFFDVKKPVFDFDIKLGKNLVNQTSISDCWYILQRADAVITMDSGILHLAGTTDTHIIHLGSNIKPEFRAPYRHNTQNYKYIYVRGGCDLECGSNAKYGVKEWGTIQGVPPLVKCLENKSSFECHPSVKRVFETVKNLDL